MCSVSQWSLPTNDMCHKCVHLSNLSVLFQNPNFGQKVAYPMDMLALFMVSVAEDNAPHRH